MAKKYTLGRGKLFFDQFKKGTTQLTGERYFGNTPEFNLTVESESLDHFNSDEGVRTKDDSVLLELNRTGNFITDHIDVRNVALFLLGEVTNLSVAAQQAQEDTFTVKQGLFYQLGRTVENPSGAREVTVTAVSASGGSTLVEGTDYRVEAALGRIEIIEGGAIEDDTEITVTYDVAASTRQQVITAADAAVDGSLRFIATNPKGELHDYFFPHVRLTPSGDFALKGDEWQQIGFDVEILKLDGQTESIYIDGRAVAA